MLLDELNDQMTTRPASDGARVVDLRGLAGAARAHGGVLEDPSGVRRRWVARIAGVTVLLLGAWIVALVLGGLGLFPTGAVPLAPAIQRALSDPPSNATHRSPASGAPSPVRQDPGVDARGTSRPAPAPARRSTSSGQDRHRGATRPPGSTDPRHPVPGTQGPAPHRGAAPDTPRAAPSPAVTPGAAATPSPGKRADAPGQARTVPGPTTAPGRADTAPGHAVAPVVTPAGADHPAPPKRRAKDPATQGTTSG